MTALEMETAMLILGACIFCLACVGGGVMWRCCFLHGHRAGIAGGAGADVPTLHRSVVVV